MTACMRRIRAWDLFYERNGIDWKKKCSLFPIMTMEEWGKTGVKYFRVTCRNFSNTEILTFSFIECSWVMKLEYLLCSIIFKILILKLQSLTTLFNFISLLTFPFRILKFDLYVKIYQKNFFANTLRKNRSLQSLKLLPKLKLIFEKNLIFF